MHLISKEIYKILRFENLSDEVIKDIINVNCLPITLLTKKLIPNFIKRLP
jgi:hypothetical protein